jgi:hypothetical protein
VTAASSTAAASSRWMSYLDVMFETRYSEAKAREVMHEVGLVGTGKSLRITREAFDRWVSQQERRKASHAR